MIQQQDKKIHELILNPDQIDQEFICVICQELVIEPKECSLCSHLFCSKCITQWLKNQIICPYKCSNNQLILKNPNRIVKNQIDKTLLKCPNQHQGCEVNFDLGLYDTHLIQCEYAQVKCQFVNCNFENIRKIVQVHEQTCEFKDDPQNIIHQQQLLQQQREEQLKKQKEQEAKKLLHFCIQGHVLEWTYLMENAKCGNCFSYKDSRYICRVCNSRYCAQCKPTKIIDGRCPSNHLLTQNYCYSTDEYECDNCGDDIEEGRRFQSDRSCDFDLCRKCFEKLSIN